MKKQELINFTDYIHRCFGIDYFLESEHLVNDYLTITDTNNDVSSKNATTPIPSQKDIKKWCDEIKLYRTPDYIEGYSNGCHAMRNSIKH